MQLGQTAFFWLLAKMAVYQIKESTQKLLLYDLRHALQCDWSHTGTPIKCHHISARGTSHVINGKEP